MKKLYALFNTQDNVEYFTEEMRGKVRLKLNNAFADKIPVFNTLYLRTFIEIFFSRFTSIKFFDGEEIPSDYIFLFTLTELEEIFRQEIEYHVIRKKLPVWLSSVSLDTEQFIKIILAYDSIQKTRYNSPLLKFDSIREAERFLFEIFGNLTRVSIANSWFITVDNLVILYKINETNVK